MKNLYVLVGSEFIPEAVFNMNPKIWEECILCDFANGTIVLEVTGKGLLEISSLGGISDMKEDFTAEMVVDFYFLPSSISSQVAVQKVARLLNQRRIVLSNLDKDTLKAARDIGVKLIPEGCAV